ncbi:MAG: 6-pyruvoyl-tetrahydropterin synthase-related protein, partial [Candidatus Altiarchaeota archaeon]
RGIDLLTLIAVFWLLFSYFNPELLLLKTTLAGGDTCAHNYLAKYMRDYLLPHGKLSGWSQGWWAGFPIFQYYFFMPYLITAFLSYLIPLEIAFKLVSVLGIFTLPLVTYLSLRMMGLRFPTPAMASVLSLLFLFHERQKVWGINIPSTLAGEISVSISFSAMVLFLGVLYKSVSEGRFRVSSPLLFSLVLFTHLTTALVAGLTSLFFLITVDKKKFFRNVSILAKTYLLAFLLTAFWTLPVLGKWGYSVGFGEEWSINPLSLYPPEAWIAMPLAAYALLRALLKRESAVVYIFFSMASSIFLFYNAYELNLVNIRFWPFHYYYLFVLAAYGLSTLSFDVSGLLGRVAKNMPLAELYSRLLPLLVSVIVIAYLNSAVTFTKDWIVGNFEGYESKMAWNSFNGILNLLSGTPGRAANDLSDKNVPICSSRAFEALPYFNGKPIIEGGIVQSGLSSLFTYYIQCESSTHCAGFPRIMTPTSFNFTSATEHMKLHNVKHFIAVEEQVKSALRNNSEWRLRGRFGQHEVYELVSNKGNYVYVPKYMPVLTRDVDWKFLAMRWFEDTQNLDTPIALDDDITEEDRRNFLEVYPDSRIVWSTLIGRQPEHMGEWLLCGVFPNPRIAPLTSENSWNSSLDYGLNVSYINEENVKPADGVECSEGKRWFKYYGHGNGFIDLYTAYEPNAEGVVAYAATYVYSPDDRKALFWYGSDDGVRVWLNGRLVHVNHVHRGTKGLTDKVELNLSAGWNLILVKIENVVSSWGLYSSLTDSNGTLMRDVSVRVSPEIGLGVIDLKARPIDNNCFITESVNEEEITFNTSCPGKPHIIKVSYFPNWMVEGARKVYLVTPDFMLVYPQGRDVRLYYGNTAVDNIGLALTFLGLLTVVLHFIRRKNETRR